MVEMNDAELVAGALTGDNDAFIMLFDRYNKTIYNIIYRMVNDHDDAEEISQRVFIKIYDSLKKYKPELKFFSWIYRIALNETLNYLKQKRNFDDLSVEIISEDRKPDEIFIGTEVKENIDMALMSLEPQYRVLIVLKHIDDRKYEEIAEIVGISVKKVKSRLHTARLLLKDALIKIGLVENG